MAWIMDQIEVLINGYGYGYVYGYGLSFIMAYGFGLWFH